jgi:hypothetical protein
MEHFDDCNNVLLCLSPSRDDPRLDAAAKTFKRETKDYRSHIGKIVNALKHSQRNLGTTLFHTAHTVDLGYFVEGPDASGHIGPDPEIHREGKTAFSFARDLRFNACGLYFLGNALMAALASFRKISPSPVSPKEGNEPDQVFDTLRRISLLPLRFFPDEMTKPIPMVRGTGSFDRPEIVLEYPSTVRITLAPGNQRVSFGGDGVAQTFRIPYMG